MNALGVDIFPPLKGPLEDEAIRSALGNALAGV